ncbi:MAG: UDP-N-acetylmuramoyl-L-alanyl-D-glutamate--2,6-diaminopimelate ligase [Bacteroidales bacterium]
MTRKKQLSDILYRTGAKETWGTPHCTILSVTADSRQVDPGALFVAVKGLTTDGHQYINEAIRAGATAIMCEDMPPELTPGICYIRVPDTTRAMAVAAGNFYDHPSEKLKLVGVTGTNGKTTTVGLLHEVFTRLGHTCGLISTISNKVGSNASVAKYTTPDVLSTNSLLRQMVDAGCEYAFMEVSSHALTQGRTEGLYFSGAIFTNISHDHLDYHQTFKEYLRAKQLLFSDLRPSAFALTNLDDKNGMIILQNTKATVKTYSLRAMADYKGKMLENSFEGLHLRIGKQEVWTKLTGRFNAYNILAVYGTGHMLGKQSDQLLTAISACEPPEGRFEYFRNKNNITGIVDYAHTPDALENVLKNISDLRGGQEKLITVIGCGGDRDKTKRPAMATIAAGYSDQVIFTSDNPRTENPEVIINDMVAGLELDPVLKKKYITITNRKEAINVACVMAREEDIILVAGKGHEKYQEINGVRHPFDDKALLQEFLNR